MTERENRHRELCQILLHAEKCGDWTKIIKFLNGVSHRATLLKVVQWIETYSPYVVRFDGKIPTKIAKRGKAFALDQANAHPYWTIGPVEAKKKKLPIDQPELKEVDINAAFVMFKKNPNEKSYLLLKEKMDEYRGVVVRKRKFPKVKIRLVQGGAYGLGKNRKH